MQTAGTLRGTRAISLLVLLVSLTDYVYSSPLQFLPDIPGYIPVYIRHGDEPLENIHPGLAEAFGESSSSAKTLLDDTLVHASDNFKENDIDALLEESKTHEYPLRVRAAESRSFATINDDEGKNPNKPKLLNIYQLPDDNDSRPRRRHRGRGRTRNENWRAPSFKVSPLSDVEKEELEKLAVEVEKEETKPNDIYVPNSKYPEISPRVSHNRRKHNRNNFFAPAKVQNPFDESLRNQPEVAGISKISHNYYDTATSEVNSKEPFKKQRSATISSNVGKLSSPIGLPIENANNKDTSKEEPPIKEQRPAILSNVDKISPIDLPDESGINENNEMKNPTELNDEIATE